MYVFGDEMMRATIIVVNIVLVDTVPSILISDEFIVYMAVIFYSIWINRNLITHGSSTPNLQDTSKLIFKSVTIHSKTQLSKRHTELCS